MCVVGCGGGVVGCGWGEQSQHPDEGDGPPHSDEYAVWGKGCELNTSQQADGILNER